MVYSYKISETRPRGQLRITKLLKKIMHIKPVTLLLHRIWFPERGNEKGSPVQFRRYPRSCKGFFIPGRIVKNALKGTTAALCAVGRF